MARLGGACIVHLYHCYPTSNRDRVLRTDLINISLLAVVQIGKCLLNCLQNRSYSYQSFCGSALHIPLGLPTTRPSIFEQGPGLARPA